MVAAKAAWGTRSAGAGTASTGNEVEYLVAMAEAAMVEAEMEYPAAMVEAEAEYPAATAEA